MDEMMKLEEMAMEITNKIMIFAIDNKLLTADINADILIDLYIKSISNKA